MLVKLVYTRRVQTRHKIVNSKARFRFCH